MPDRRKKKPMPRNYGMWPTKYERLGTFNPEQAPPHLYVIKQDSRAANHDLGDLIGSLFIIIGAFTVVGCIGIGAFLLVTAFG